MKSIKYLALVSVLATLVSLPAAAQTSVQGQIIQNTTREAVNTEHSVKTTDLRSSNSASQAMVAVVSVPTQIDISQNQPQNINLILAQQ